MNNLSYTQTDLKKAYQLVQHDLFNTLLKMKNGEATRFGSLGKFTKTERKQKCGWDKNTYAYYQIKFSMFSSLKNELDKQISKKYRTR